MRLVDADAECERLLDFIAQNDSGIKYAIERRDMTMLEDIFFDFFNGIHTVYDVDKVVGKLEERKAYILKEFVLAEKSQRVKDISLARINEIDGIIETVKSGYTEGIP